MGDSYINEGKERISISKPSLRFRYVTPSEKSNSLVTVTAKLELVLERVTFRFVSSHYWTDVNLAEPEILTSTKLLKSWDFLAQSALPLLATLVQQLVMASSLYTYYVRNADRLGKTCKYKE